MEKLSHIIVPIHGNPEDDNALYLGCMTGKRNKARVTVLYVVEVKRSLPVDAEMPPLISAGLNQPTSHPSQQTAPRTPGTITMPVSRPSSMFPITAIKPQTQKNS